MHLCSVKGGCVWGFFVCFVLLACLFSFPLQLWFAAVALCMLDSFCVRVCNCLCCVFFAVHAAPPAQGSRVTQIPTWDTTCWFLQLPRRPSRSAQRQRVVKEITGEWRRLPFLLPSRACAPLACVCVQSVAGRGAAAQATAGGDPQTRGGGASEAGWGEEAAGGRGESPMGGGGEGQSVRPSVCPSRLKYTVSKHTFSSMLHFLKAVWVC